VIWAPFFQIKARWPPFFQISLAAIFACIFREFAQIFRVLRRFSQILPEFSEISPKFSSNQNFGGELAPPSLTPLSPSPLT